MSARFVAEAGRLDVEVDDDGARYPVTVDPLFSSPSATHAPGVAAAAFGASVASSGDVDGDGYADILVGAPQHDGGDVAEGKAYLYLGGASGPSVDPDWTYEGGQANAWLGFRVASAGDINGDGRADVLIAAPLHDAGGTDAGRALLFLGTATGLAPSPAWSLDGGQAHAWLGRSITCGGDVNGDGYSDVVIGAPRHQADADHLGRVLVFHGSAGGLGATPALVLDGDRYAYLGTEISWAGDVNADGYDDVLLGAGLRMTASDGDVTESRGFLHHGSASGLGASPAWTLSESQAEELLGAAVSGIGDASGDGYADIAVGAPWWDGVSTGEAGAVRVFAGSASGLGATPAVTLSGTTTGENFGASLAMAGDVNADGYGDLLVAAPARDGALGREGRVVAFHGSPSGLGTTPAWEVEGGAQGEELGAAVAGVGDVDADGYSDVVVSAPLADVFLDGNWSVVSGRTAFFRGSAAGLASSPGWQHEPNQAGAALGASVASAGDVNADGFSDVVVGAPGFDAGSAGEGSAFLFVGSAAGLPTIPTWSHSGGTTASELGASVSGAGDVDGDGHDDVIVGAPGHATGKGQVRLFLGTTAGLAGSPAWTATGGAAGDRLGSAVTGAGDVNGDGHADVAAGAPGVANGMISGAGLVVAWHGSRAGLPSTPSWSDLGTQTGEALGSALARAGDVAADGYSDLLVGAPGASNGQAGEGQARLYVGSASGLASTPAWTWESDQAGAAAGTSVASAGDVNRDAYSDVMVGAPGYDDAGADRGVAWVFHGSASGLGASPSRTLLGPAAGARWGTAVSAAGDIDGDGHADVVIGAPRWTDAFTEEGRAAIHLGSSTGIGSAPAWTRDGGEAGALLGQAVASAGDVNGDAFGDVIVGMPGHSAGSAGEGNALLFLGNAGDAVARPMRQLDGSASDPIALMGLTDTNGDLTLRALARSPFGRAGLRLESELAALGAGFDGTGMVLGSYADSGAPTGGGSFLVLDQLRTAPTTGVHAWRLRVRADVPQLPWVSPWRGLPGSSDLEGKVRR